MPIDARLLTSPPVSVPAQLVRSSLASYNELEATLIHGWPSCSFAKAELAHRETDAFLANGGSIGNCNDYMLGTRIDERGKENQQSITQVGQCQPNKESFAKNDTLDGHPFKRTKQPHLGRKRRKKKDFPSANPFCTAFSLAVITRVATKP